MSRVREQLEFYFGDANLLKDKFLLQQIEEHADGFVPVAVLLGFKKCAARVPAASTHALTIAVYAQDAAAGGHAGHCETRGADKQGAGTEPRRRRAATRTATPRAR